MICCCSKKKSSDYTLDNSYDGKVQQDGRISENQNSSSIHTGKGALSSSNHNIPAEAQLDKSTVSATRREKQPITEQPASTNQNVITEQAESTNQSAVGVEEQSELTNQKAVVVEDIVLSQNYTDSNCKPNLPEETKVESHSNTHNIAESPDTAQIENQFISVISVNTASSKADASPRSNLESSDNNHFSQIKISLDNLEQSVGELEALPPGEAAKAVPDVANQLKALTPQVLSITKDPVKMSGDMSTMLARLEAVTSRLENLAASGGSGGAGATDDLPEWFDDFEKGWVPQFNTFVKGCEDIGGDVKELGALVKKAFDAHRAYLLIAAQSHMPSQADNQELLKPLSQAIGDVQSFVEKKRSSKQFNHLMSVSEVIPFLGWVSIAPKPASYIQSMEESGQFYVNRVVKDFKESDPKQVDWARSIIKLLKAFQQYVKDSHGQGLSWNKDGKDFREVAKSGSSAPPPPPPPSAGGPPPPPPPPPGPPPADLVLGGGAPAKSDDDGRADLFAALNKGGDITKGLKKVSDDMKTHKNPALRQGPAPFKAPASTKPVTAPKPGAKPVAAVKPPVFERVDKKWMVEYQKNNQNLVIENPELKQTVYMFKCENSVLQVKGKLNSIIIDSCKKCGIVFEDLLSSIEFVNCQSVKAQANGTVRTVSVDKTDGCQIYLTEKSLDAEIVSAKSSEMNVLVVKPDGDLTEFALPEQFKSVWDGKKFVTTTMDLNL